MNKKKLALIISLVGILLVIGGGAMHLYNKHKQEELKRNRKYEVSLVKALKNSYEGIEEIEISNPTYDDIVGGWSCDLKITFNDNEIIAYRIGHDLDSKQNYNGHMGEKGDTNEEINKKWDQLYSHKGTTTNRVKVVYSNKDEGEQ